MERNVRMLEKPETCHIEYLRDILKFILNSEPLYKKQKYGR